MHRHLFAAFLLLALSGCGDEESNCAFPTCGDGTVCASEECDDRNTRPGDGCSSMCKVEDPGCVDCLYRGETSQHQPFEVQVEGGAITRITFNASATEPACSSGAGCAGDAMICFEIIFDPPADSCVLPDTFDCDDCPDAGSCLGLSGEFFASSAHGEVESSLDTSPGCFLSLEPDPVTWTATCIPGATPSACPLSAASERTEFSLPGGRGRVVRVVTQ